MCRRKIRAGDLHVAATVNLEVSITGDKRLGSGFVMVSTSFILAANAAFFRFTVALLLLVDRSNELNIAARNEPNTITALQR